MTEVPTRDRPDPELRCEPDRDHLQELPDGSGCSEVWEYLSARRGDEEGTPT